MASLTDAYARVRAQTESNNAAREEDGGAMQEILGGLLGELNADLDPANVDKPLSVYGQALDSIIPFKQRQIEKAAEVRARVAQAQFTAETDIRQQGIAEQLDAKMTSEAASRKAANIDIFNINKHSFQLDEPSNLSFMEAAVAETPSLAPLIAKRNSTGHLFMVLPEGAEEKIEYGQVIYTHPTTGQKLYSTGDSSAKNLNFAYNRLSKELTENLLASDFSKAQILNIPSKDRIKLFENRKFREVLERTVAEVSPKLFESHEIYNAAIGEHTKEMTTRLDKELAYIDRAIVTQQQIAKQYVTDRAPSKITLFNNAVKEIERLEGSRLGLQVGGNYQRAVNAEVTKIAFALALMKKEKVTPETAKVNIQVAIQIARNSGKLKDFKRAHEVYYREGLEKIKQGVTPTNPPPTKPPEGNAKPAVRKKATPTSERVEPTEEAGG